MLMRSLLVAMLLFVLTGLNAQTADELLKQTLKKFPGLVDINNHQWVELDGESQLIFPVNTSTTASAWILYNASAKEAVIKDTFDFIFDYKISSTLSYILYSRTKDDNQQIFYTKWNGLPTQPAPAPLTIEVLHQGRFTKGYIGITAQGSTMPVYLHESGVTEALQGLPDNSVLLPMQSIKFQLAIPPSGGTMLLVDKKMHAVYSSIDSLPGEKYLLQRDNKFWYLRFSGNKLDSIGPFSFAEKFAPKQEYGVVKEESGKFKALHLDDFTLLNVPLQSDEQADTLIHLNGSNRFACRYSAPVTLWSLLEADGTNTLNKKEPRLFVGPGQLIRSVYRNAVFISNGNDKADFFSNIADSKSGKGTLDNIDFNSIKGYRYSFEVPGPKKNNKPTTDTKSVNIVIANTFKDRAKRVSFINEDAAAFKSLEPNLANFAYNNGRFILLKDRVTWYAYDLEQSAHIRPADAGSKVSWMLDFVALDKKAGIFYSIAQLNGNGANTIVYINHRGTTITKQNSFLNIKRPK